jgi:hypothetical protein
LSNLAGGLEPFLDDFLTERRFLPNEKSILILLLILPEKFFLEELIN